jgi:hypothetical protein
MYEPSEKVIKTFVRKNWKISDGYIDRNVTMMVTPRVVVLETINKTFFLYLFSKIFFYLRRKFESILIVQLWKALN